MHPSMQGSALTASVAIETDGELYQLLRGTTAALTSYVGQLVACECRRRGLLCAEGWLFCTA